MLDGVILRKGLVMKKWLSIIIFALVAPLLCAQDPGAEVRKALQPYLDRGELPGFVVIVADGDKVLYSDCLGYSNIEKQQKTSLEGLYWMASQTKSVSATALMMLVDEGKIDLDAPISTYLPELKKMTVVRNQSSSSLEMDYTTKPITVRMLLSHTSGMTKHDGIVSAMGKMDIYSFSVGTYATALTPLLFQPGEGYHYTNQGINTAMAVVEKMSGMTYSEFLQERLFDPLEMGSATFWPSVKQQEKLAVPYRYEEGKLVASEFQNFQTPLEECAKRFANAGGGLFCAPEDMVKFYQMIAGGGLYNGKRYLSEQAIDIMGSKQTPASRKEPYGLCWRVVDGYMGHGGAGGTYASVYRKRGITILYFICMQGKSKGREALKAYETAVKKSYGITDKSIIDF